MFCGAKYTHHTFTPIIKHLITTTVNKHPAKKSFIDKNMRKSHCIKLCISHKIKLPPPLKNYCPNKSNYKNYLQQINPLTPPVYSPGHYHPDPSKILRTKNIIACKLAISLLHPAPPPPFLSLPPPPPRATTRACG